MSVSNILIISVMEGEEKDIGTGIKKIEEYKDATQEEQSMKRNVQLGFIKIKNFSL